MDLPPKLKSMDLKVHPIFGKKKGLKSFQAKCLEECRNLNLIYFCLEPRNCPTLVLTLLMKYSWTPYDNINGWNVSISIEITLPISPYKIFLNDSNGHGFYFLNVIILIFE